MAKKKICVVVTAAMNLWSLYRDQFLYLQENGFEVTALAGKGKEHLMLREQGIKTVIIPMKKNPAIFNDLLSFLRLICFFLFNRYSLVSVSTPKASLLAGLAAKITLQPKIIFTLRGRAYENRTGITRKLYDKIDQFICSISDAVFCISKEIMTDFITKGLCSKDKIFVIGSGSSNGVDIKRFTKSDNLISQGKMLRKSLGILNEDICILYSGRIRKDKGVNELIKAFQIISTSNNNIHLIIQGEYEPLDPLETEVLTTIKSNLKIHIEGWCSDVQKYFAAADIFAFPSHREGFGNVAIEASAMELPVVAFDVIGCRESVVHQKTGILCNYLDYYKFADALLKLIENKDLRKQMGAAGRKRIIEEFDCHLIWKTIVDIYNTLIADYDIKQKQVTNCFFYEETKIQLSVSKNL